MKKSLPLLLAIFFASCSTPMKHPMTEGPVTAMNEQPLNRDLASEINPVFTEASQIFKSAEIATPEFIKNHATSTCVVISKREGPETTLTLNLVNRGNGIYEDSFDESICKTVACIAGHSQFYGYKKGIGLKSTSEYKHFDYISGTKKSDTHVELRKDGDSFIGEVQFNIGFFGDKYEPRQYLRCSN